jgi:hypothetical protein
VLLWCVVYYCSVVYVVGEAHPGNHYLVRFQDRLLWVMILERGAGYCTVNIKGLELQETSCHTTEAVRLDDVFDLAFDHESTSTLGRFNKYPLHTLTPVDAANIKAYSDARNVLTGIIDSPDSLAMVKTSFMKSLVWVLLHHVNKAKVKERDAQRNPPPKSMSKEKDIFQSADKKEKHELEEINHNQQQAKNASSKNVGASKHDIVSKKQSIKVEGNVNGSAGDPRASDSRPKSAARQRKSSWSSTSIKSFTDSIWSDDGHSYGANKKTPAKATPLRTTDLPKIDAKPARPPTAKRQNFHDDIDDLFEEIEFGVPVYDVTKPKPAPQQHSGLSKLSPVKKNTFGNSIYKPVTNLAGSPDFKCAYSSHISVPQRWRELPIDYSQLSKLLGQFPKDWYKHVLGLLDWSGCGQSTSHIVTEVSLDDALTNCYAQLIMACYSIFDSQGLYIICTLHIFVYIY